MGTDPGEAALRFARAGVAALPCLSPRDRYAVAKQLSRLIALESERTAIVADMVDRLAMAVRGSLPIDAARIVTTLEAGLAILREEKGTRA